MQWVKVKKSIIAGPGQRPAKPHPIPNADAPSTSLASITLLVGIASFSQKIGFFFFLMMSGKVMKFTKSPPIMTNINDGSQPSYIVKKLTILVLLHIPLIASPIPNINPRKNETGISILSNFFSALMHLKAAKITKPIKMQHQSAIEK